MSISALANKASELLNYYDNVRSDIDARIAALNAADPQSVRTIHVHSVDGDNDAGTGELNDPFLTLDRALAFQAITNMPAATNIILLDAGPHVLTKVSWCYGVIHIRASTTLIDSEGVYPRIVQANQMSITHPTLHMPRILVGVGSVIWVRDVDIETAATAHHESSGLFGSSVAGGVGELAFDSSELGLSSVGRRPEIAIGATNLVGFYSANALTFRNYNVRMISGGTGFLVDMTAVSGTLNTMALTLDSGLTLRGLIDGVTYHASITDAPRNVLSNAVLSPI